VSKYAWPWDQDTQSWSLEADPRYQVKDFTLAKINAGEPGYDMLIDGHVVDAAYKCEEAFARLEARYEYEDHGADLELARTRLRQARERLLDRYPRVARDGVLSSILEGLADALGAGPELDVSAAQPREPDMLFRARIAENADIVLDASQCVVLEVAPADARQAPRRATITDVSTVIAALTDALAAQYSALAEAEKSRQDGPDEKRRSEGRLTRREAVEHLAELTHAQRGHIIAVVDRAQRYQRLGEQRFQAAGGSDAVFLVSWSQDGFWRVVPAEKA
jgi:hypothetical protein